MTDQSWIQGTALLTVNLRDRELSEEQKRLRGGSYRAALDHLTDREWLAAVNDCIQAQDWYPTIRELLDYASRQRAALPSERQIAQDTRSIEERREETKRGLELVKTKVAELGLVRLTPERREELRQQSRKIAAEEART